MKSTILFVATALVFGAVSTQAAASGPDVKPARGAAMFERLDANGDGVIDREEAAKAPRLAQRFDRLDRNNDGRLEANELRGRQHGKARHRGAGFGQRMHPGMGAAALDTDGDGRISRAELEAATQARGRGMGAARLLAHFDAIDANRDGHIVRGELRAWQQAQRPQREAAMEQRFQAWFAAADMNGDGRLSRVEVTEKMPRLADRFAWLDENGDGFLSREEIRPQRSR